ncbi:MAG TPA: plasmid pRiA4b ORF-3 family protein, partial [Casimicrobiaceae bacterium]|nr:plasmid pRiA4b ORF-3 family protein [Casimicrobiaceae bacterium]
MPSARKTPLRVVKAAAPVYQLRIELDDVRPAVWRRLQVSGAVKLHKLHVILQHTMGWCGGHLHEFIIGGQNYGIPDPDFPGGPSVRREDRVTLAAALGVSRSFRYLYDFGDGWEHHIKLEKTLAPEPGLPPPLC